MKIPLAKFFRLPVIGLITLAMVAVLAALPRQSNRLFAGGGCQIWQYSATEPPLCLLSRSPTYVQYSGYNGGYYQPYGQPYSGSGYNNYQHQANTPYSPVHETLCSWNHTLPQPPNCAQYQTNYPAPYSGYQSYPNSYNQPYSNSYSGYPMYGNAGYNNYQANTPYAPVHETPCSWNHTLPQPPNCAQYQTNYPAPYSGYQQPYSNTTYPAPTPYNSSYNNYQNPNYGGNYPTQDYQAYNNSVPVNNGQYNAGSYSVPDGYTYVPPSNY